MQPIGVQLGDAAKEIDDSQLKEDEAECPGGRGGCRPNPPPRDIDRECPADREEHHQETHQTDEIEVIQIVGLIEQKKISETEEHRDGTQPRPKSDAEANGKKDEEARVPVNSRGGPFGNPTKAEIFEVELGIDPVAFNSIVLKVPPIFPKQNRGKDNPEVN